MNPLLYPNLTMALIPGSRIGSYEIVALLGAGGRGEVYRASDSKLSREVAVKILPGSVAAEPAALARFERAGVASDPVAGWYAEDVPTHHQHMKPTAGSAAR